MVCACEDRIIEGVLLTQATEGFVGAELEKVVISGLFEAFYEERCVQLSDFCVPLQRALEGFGMSGLISLVLFIVAFNEGGWWWAGAIFFLLAAFKSTSSSSVQTESSVTTDFDSGD